ncbi:MAG: hypothetical protein QOF77_1018 [Solirubrobacteraceae bacterium]|jgi:hypothetical protein|nr:hypothetical protein [Solirubrobacteraceae bacterium]
MESAMTLTRPRTGPAWLARLLAVPAAVWARLSFAAMSLAALIGFFIYPTYPVYDSVYSLLWGREAVHLHALSFQVYRAPTEHPLAIAFSALLAPLGQHAERVMIAATIASFLVLAAGLYRLGRLAFTPLVGAAAVLLLVTRFNLSFLAIRGYVDIPYMAIIVWAAALEAERPRRGTLVFVLLLAGELLRPEAWILAGLYFLWCAWRAAWPRRVLYAALTAAGPVLWAGLDALETGDPLFSLHSTSNLAGSLGRNTGLGSVPGLLWQYLVRLDKTPLLVGAIAGVVLAVWLVPRRVGMPLALLATGLATFGLIGAAGLSVIDRYLLVPALMAIVFCAVALAGWTMLEPGGLVRRVWALGAALLLLYGAASAASTLSVQKLQTELGFRGDSHVALAAILRNSRVRAGLRCGPLTVPNHKLVPDARWILGRGSGQVIALSQALSEQKAGRPQLLARTRHGVQLVANDLAVLRQALVDATDDPREQVPLAGFDRVARTQYYGAYVHC